MSDNILFNMLKERGWPVTFLAEGEHFGRNIKVITFDGPFGKDSTRARDATANRIRDEVLKILPEHPPEDVLVGFVDLAGGGDLAQISQ